MFAHDICSGSSVAIATAAASARYLLSLLLLLLLMRRFDLSYHKNPSCSREMQQTPSPEDPIGYARTSCSPLNNGFTYQVRFHQCLSTNIVVVAQEDDCKNSNRSASTVFAEREVMSPVCSMRSIRTWTARRSEAPKKIRRGLRNSGNSVWRHGPFRLERALRI